MEEDFKKKEKLFERMQMAFNPKVMTQEEFFKAFEKVMAIFIAMKEANIKQISLMDEKYKQIISELESFTTKTLSNISGMVKKDNEQEVSNIKKEMSKMMSDCMDMMSKMEEKMDEVENGKDADEQKIIDDLTKIIPKKEDILNDIEKDLPKFGIAFRDGLELLSEGEKLKIEAIQDLRPELNDSKKTKTQNVGGGFSTMAMNFHLIDDETPTGTVDGSNTTFTIANIPLPASSLKVFVNGQRMRITTDYTFSGNAIEFLIAPPTGSIILVDYRV